MVSNPHSIVRIEQNNCQNCRRCVRSCGVKAIRFKGGSASVAGSRCIGCGACYLACPNGAVQMANGVEKARQLVRGNATVAVSLSPVWVTEFPDIAPRRMVEALKLLGFEHVSETTLGANRVIEETARIIRENPSFHISTLCPAANDLVRKYHPDLAERLAPVDTPSVAHAKMLKSWYGSEVRVVVISSCTAEKEVAARYPELIAAALTFEELRQWMGEDNVDFDLIPGNRSYRFEPFAANRNTAYVLERGAFDRDFLEQHSIQGVRTFHFSGLTALTRVLEAPGNLKVGVPVLLELFACEGGCIGGAGATRRSLPLQNELAIRDYDRLGRTNPSYTLPLVHLKAEYRAEPATEGIPEDRLSEALASIGIRSAKECPDCGACGYTACREFAGALVLGDAERSMCVRYLEHMARDKFERLLQKMPSGVVIVDERLQIVEANANFARVLGPEAELFHDSVPGMRGCDAARFIPFHKLFASVLESGEEIVERDVQMKGRLLKVTLFTLQKNRLVCGIVRNLFQADVRNEEIINRSQRVIRENLETVQKIAYLLGENASRTEAILNSIIESQLSAGDEKQ